MALSQPLVGLTTRRWPASMLGEAMPPAYNDALFDVGLSDYSAALTRAGGVAVHVNRDAPVDALVELLDALVLTGGADVDPRRYGSHHPERVGPVEPARDAWEAMLLEAAEADRLPVLAICRGMQLLNVTRGGTLIEDIASGAGAGHPRFDRPRGEVAHCVEVEPGTLAASLYGASVTVNSLHHQGIDRVGEGLVVAGRAPDGTVEILERPGHPVLAVQWHPEALDSDPGFAWLIDAATRRRHERG